MQENGGVRALAKLRAGWSDHETDFAACFEGAADEENTAGLKILTAVRDMLMERLPDAGQHKLFLMVCPELKIQHLPRLAPVGVVRQLITLRINSPDKCKEHDKLFVASNMRGAPAEAIEAMLDNRQLFMHTFLGDLLTLCARMVKDMHDHVDTKTSSSRQIDGAAAGAGQSVPYEMLTELLKQAVDKRVVAGSTGFQGSMACDSIFELVWLQALDSEKGLLVVMDRSLSSTNSLEKALEKQQQEYEKEKEHEQSSAAGITCTLLLHSPLLSVSARVEGSVLIEQLVPATKVPEVAWSVTPIDDDDDEDVDAEGTGAVKVKTDVEADVEAEGVSASRVPPEPPAHVVGEDALASAIVLAATMKASHLLLRLVPSAFEFRTVKRTCVGGNVRYQQAEHPDSGWKRVDVS